MKQLSLIINIVLLLAVGFLYYLHFSGGKHERKNMPATTSTGNAAGCPATSVPVIAYVELDSLNSNVTFIKNKKEELEVEQKSIQNNYESQYKDLEMQRNNFLKKGAAITQQEADEFQAKLMKGQKEIEEEKQSRTQVLAAKSAKIMEQMQSKLKEFLDAYNKEKKYTYILASGTGLDYMFYKDSTLNITHDIVKGLNEQMSQPDK